MLYIHIPFCLKKCNYCDFLSAPAGSEIQEQYVEALLGEIDREAVFYQNKRVDTVFFGGGTPSILRYELMERVMKSLKENFNFTDSPEISIEVNPGTVDREKLQTYKQMGINRLSIGLQSLNDKELQLLGRIHNTDDFYRTYQESRQAGFDNINIDIMAALPGQTMADYQKTLKGVACLHPEHISAYSLIIEEGTPFYEIYGKNKTNAEENPKGSDKRLMLPTEELEREMYYETCDYLEQNDFQHYEISNFAKSGKSCRHNTGYWKRKDYLGLGMGAASLIKNERWNNTSDRESYLKNSGHEMVQRLSVKDQMEEFMFLGLRMMEGVSEEEFFQTFGQSLKEIYEKPLAKLEKEKLLKWDIIDGENRIKLTKYGIDISNYVFSEFLF